MSRSRKPNTAKPEPVADEQEPVADEQEPEREPEPVADEQEPVADEQEPEPGDVFRAAYAAAIEAARDNSGAIPAEPLDAVTVAFRALRGNARALLPAQVGADAQRAALAATPLDVAALTAIGTLSDVFAAAIAQPTRSEPKPTREPRDVAADALAALLLAQDALLSGFDPADADVIRDTAQERAAYPEHAGPTGLVLTPHAVTAERVLRAAHGKRTGAGSTGSGDRTRPADAAKPGQVAAHIAQVVASDPERVWTCADIAAAPSDAYPADAPRRPSAGAIHRDVKRGNVPGVVATRSERGALAATAA